MQTNILPQSVSLQVQSAIQNSLLRSLHFQFFLPSAGAGRSSGLQPQWSRQALRGPKQAIPAFLIEIPLLARATQDRNKIEQSNMQSSHWKKNNMYYSHLYQKQIKVQSCLIIRHMQGTATHISQNMTMRTKIIIH